MALKLASLCMQKLNNTSFYLFIFLIKFFNSLGKKIKAISDQLIIKYRYHRRPFKMVNKKESES